MAIHLLPYVDDDNSTVGVTLDVTCYGKRDHSFYAITFKLQPKSFTLGFFKHQRSEK